MKLHSQKKDPVNAKAKAAKAAKVVTMLRKHRRHGRELDGGEAFVPDIRYGFVPMSDGDVEAAGEEFIAGATSNEPIGELARDETYLEEVGGVVLQMDDDDGDDELPYEELH